MRHYRTFNAPAAFTFICSTCPEEFTANTPTLYCPRCTHTLEKSGFDTRTGEMSGS